MQGAARVTALNASRPEVWDCPAFICTSLRNTMLKKLVFKDENHRLLSFTDDVDKIVKKFADEGYEISRPDACKAWEEYSELYCATWLFLGEEVTSTEFYDLLAFFESQT
jgi:hypothetical protein